MVELLIIYLSGFLLNAAVLGISIFCNETQITKREFAMCVSLVVTSYIGTFVAIVGLIGIWIDEHGDEVFAEWNKDKEEEEV